MTSNDSSGYAPQGYYDPIETPAGIVDHDDPRTGTYLYVEIAYRGDWWGEDPLTETRHETTGDLFRSLSGRDKRYPWEALGRCTGRVYVDRKDSTTQQVGWVFVARDPEPVRRGDEQPTGLREAWVTVHEAPPTVTTTHHYATFGKEQ